MKRKMSPRGRVALLSFALLMSSTFAGCATRQGYSPGMQAKIKETWRHD